MKRSYVYSLFLSLNLVTSSAYSIFDYDRAVYAGQCEQWDCAQARLRSILIDKPNDPSVLYDLGVASYKTNDYDHAQIYFEEAAHDDTSSNELKERAYYNAGNTFFQQKKWDDSIRNYEQALFLNPDNERTKHNLEIAKNTRKKQQKEDKKKENNKDKKDDKKKNDQQKKDDKKDDQQGQQKDDQQKDDQGKDDEDKGDQGKNDGEKKPGDKKKDQQKDQKKRGEDEQDQNDIGKNDSKKPSDKDEKKDDSESQKKQGEDEKKEQQSEQKGDQKQKQTDQQKGQAADLNNESFNKVEPWLADILKERERNDASLNKQMIKSMVEKQLVGKNGQNCW